MKKYTPFNIVVYHPQTQEDKKELGQHIACVYADMVFNRVFKLNCPISQKRKLFLWINDG
ncbi:MAG: hypothetical protein IKK24_03375 [Clostridia bacterium]|nr:hypothetical protein [Clostridia bacterium]